MSLYIPSDAPIIDPRTGAISFEWLKLFDALANGSGNIPWGNIDFTASTLSDLVTRSASALNSGTLPDARFPATLPALSGVNLTTLNASNLASGSVALARLTGITTSQLAAAAGILLAQLAFTGSADANHFLRGDTTLAAITRTALLWNAGTIAAATTTFVGPLGNNATETTINVVSPLTGTIRNLYVLTDGAPGVGQTFTYTVRKSAADTAVTCTLSGAAATSGNDATNTVSVTAGNAISVKVVTSAGAASVHHQVSVELATA